MEIKKKREVKTVFWNFPFAPASRQKGFLVHNSFIQPSIDGYSKE